MTLTATANYANALRRMGRKRLSHNDSPLSGKDETGLDTFRILKGASVSTGSWNGEQKALLSLADPKPGGVSSSLVKAPSKKSPLFI